MSDAERGYVYGLVDPRNGEIRYVGATVNPDTRLYGLRSSPPNQDLAAWFNELAEAGVEAHLRLLEEGDRDRLSEIETRKIGELAKSNDLLNVEMSAGGGHGSPRAAAAPGAYPFESGDGDD